VTDRKLRNKAFKETKQKRFGIGGILKSSKFIEDKYQEDKQSLISYYNSWGIETQRSFQTLYGEIKETTTRSM
jgi:hypothetical protein